MESTPDVQSVDWSALWGIDLQAVVCEHCDSTYLVPSGTKPQRCPTCYRDTLDPHPGHPDYMSHAAPERVLPFIVTPDTVMQKVDTFARSIPLRPADLTLDNLRQRIRKTYIPVWLIDADIEANWQGEAGFHYEVVSHRERLSSGSWQTQQVNETRTRWEPHVGHLTRHYDNVIAPALERFDVLQQRIGSYKTASSTNYDPAAMQDSLIRLPARSPDSARPDAQTAFQAAAADECRQASGADEWQKFRWSARYQGEIWTQLLLPLYTLYYLDDENNPCVIYVNGQTGQVWGQRRASMKKARTRLLIAGLAALAIFACSVVVLLLGLVAGPVAILGVLGMGTGVVVGLVGLSPLFRVSNFNKQHGRERL